MNPQDRKLAILYWRLQMKVHTNPRIRAYLDELTRILKRRRIRPEILNQVGLKMATHGQI